MALDANGYYYPRFVDNAQPAAASGAVLQGDGVPDNSLGANGNVYVNISNGDIYTKSGGVWEIVSPGTGTPESGSGSPEGVLASPEGTLYTDKADPDNPRLFSKVSGSGNTGWVQLI